MIARYLWKTQWTWPFESAWSILEKFKYANAATNDIFKTALNMKSTATSMQACNNLWIYRKAVVDMEKFIDFFDIPKEHFSPLDSLRNNDLYSLVKENLYYCPICMRVGYHSYLFQLSFIYKCPFHNVDLVEAKFDGKPISYCIELKQSEAYSTMQDKTNSPAMKYFKIKNARELIDGIWDNSTIQKRMLTQSITDTQIIFFSPYANTISSMNISVQKSTDTLLNGLFFSTSNVKMIPYLTVTEEQCERAFTLIQNTARDWYEEKDLLFHKSDMEGWYIYSVIYKLLTTVYDYPKFNEVLICRCRVLFMTLI